MRLRARDVVDAVVDLDDERRSGASGGGGNDEGGDDWFELIKLDRSEERRVGKECRN